MPRPSYANVAATLAVVIALGGTAHAAGLTKNSVRSKHIVNNTVSTADLKNGSATGDDIRDNSLTGEQVKESTLGSVPQALDAATLRDLPPSAFRRAAPFVSGSALNNIPLQLVVSGYGTYRISCDTGGSSLTDDEPFVGYTNSLGAGTYAFARISAAPDGGTAADVRVFANIASAGTVAYAHRDDGLDFDLYYRSSNGAKAIHVYGIAHDDPTIAGCAGFITADIIA